MQKQSKAQRAARTAAASAARRAARDSAARAAAASALLAAPRAPPRPRARSLPRGRSPSGGLASANRASSAGPPGSFSAPVVDMAAAASAVAAMSLPPPPPPPTPAPPPATAPPTPSRPAPGGRRVIPCAYCVDALLASSSAALCVDNSAGGRRSKRCFRCASGHSCRPLHEVLEPLGIELVEELVRSGGTTTARVTELRAAIRTMKGLIEDGYYA